MPNRLSPLAQLRHEKKELRRACLQDELRLAENWDYLTNNVGSLVFHTAIKGTKSIFVPQAKSRKDESQISNLGFGNSGVMQSLLTGLTASAPLLWEISQPIIMGYLMKKVKYLFTFKKKKKE